MYYSKQQTELVKQLKVHQNYMSKQQYKTLKGKLMQGDIVSVRKGLTTIMSRYHMNVSMGRW